MPPDVLLGKNTYGSSMLGYVGLGVADICLIVVE